MTSASDLLDAYLIDDHQNLTKYKKLPKRQIIELIEASLRNYTWLREHDAELPDAHVARLKLAKLLQALHTVKKLPYTEPELRTMIDLTTPLLNYIPPDGPVDHVMEYIKENDLTPELCRSLHNFQANLRDYGSVASMQSLRQRLYTLLFMDEWDQLKPSKCWSECVRKDFRAMRGKRKEHWRRLLKHIRGNAKGLPDSWAEEAVERLEAVGLEDFKQQLAQWFAPFRSEEPLPLSITGSHVLKGLVWYVAVSGDEEAKETALWLLDVKWKQKRNVEKSMMALEVLGVTRKELMDRNLIAQPPPSKAAAALQNLMDIRALLNRVGFSEAVSNPEKMTEVHDRLMEELSEPKTPVAQHMAEAMKSMVMPNVVMDHDEGVIMVQGEQHFYRLFLSTGKIERVTDNAELELNWEKIPDYMRARLDRDHNSPMQLHTLSHYLSRESIYRNFFRVKSKS